MVPAKVLEKSTPVRIRKDAYAKLSVIAGEILHVEAHAAANILIKTVDIIPQWNLKLNIIVESLKNNNTNLLGQLSRQIANLPIVDFSQSKTYKDVLAVIASKKPGDKSKDTISLRLRNETREILESKAKMLNCSRVDAFTILIFNFEYWLEQTLKIDYLLCLVAKEDKKAITKINFSEKEFQQALETYKVVVKQKKATKKIGR